ncbi:MAG: hypothetical protein AVDCRST_MAG19-137, partial [uncultured Thermomicrobiales bacterium]
CPHSALDPQRSSAHSPPPLRSAPVPALPRSGSGLARRGGSRPSRTPARAREAASTRSKAASSTGAPPSRRRPRTSADRLLHRHGDVPAGVNPKDRPTSGLSRHRTRSSAVRVFRRLKRQIPTTDPASCATCSNRAPMPGEGRLWPVRRCAGAPRSLTTKSARWRALPGKPARAVGGSRANGRGRSG